MALEDDFEYYVTLPSLENGISSVYSKKDELTSLLNGDASSTQLRQIREKKEPVVFLLGWLGVTNRVLSKYSDMYSEKGFITIRYTMAPLNLFFGREQKVTEIAAKLLGLAEEIGVASNPIFFHAFSNNGATLYSYVSRELANTKLDVKGCMFDSCPGQRRLSAAVRAMYRSFNGPRWMKALAGFSTGAALLLIGLGELFSALVAGKLVARPPWDLIEEPSRWPQLFCYSKADDLIPYQDIEQFMSERKKLGVKVCRQEFSSGHCMHLRHHPEDYRRCIFEFLELCLQNQNDA